MGVCIIMYYFWYKHNLPPKQSASLRRVGTVFFTFFSAWPAPDILVMDTFCGSVFSSPTHSKVDVATCVETEAGIEGVVSSLDASEVGRENGGGARDLLTCSGNNSKDRNWAGGGKKKKN